MTAVAALHRTTQPSKPPLLLSPNSVLANALLRSIDIRRPRVLATRPGRIEFVVGTQINGAPHLGTNLVQTAAFLLAKITRREFSIDTVVRFGALDNGWAEKRADRTKLAHLDEDGATFTGVCLDHGNYQAHIDPADDQPYLDLATLYRNLVKERALGRSQEVLHVMMKGGDWIFGCQLVDGALAALDTPPAQLPVRIFTPQVLAPTGAKLSKSLLREQNKCVLPTDVEPWMLDTTAWPGSVDDYVDALVWLVGELLTDPKHFFRSFTVKELARLMTARPAEPTVRAHEMGIYKRYFDLIATGRKTTEIRVNDSSRKKIKEGSLIRFRCQGDEVLTRVTRVARYNSFDEMFDHESVASVNPLATRQEQLANIRQIYPPEREALGVVALGIKLIDPPRPA